VEAVDAKALSLKEEEALWASCTGAEVGAGSSDDNDDEKEDKCEVSLLFFSQRFTLLLFNFCLAHFVPRTQSGRLLANVAIPIFIACVCVVLGCCVL